jgi:hypothetical protein
MASRHAIIWTVVACLLLAGCTVTKPFYAGPTRSRDQVAWVSLAPTNRAVKLKSLDGQPIGVQWFDAMAVLPGDHDLLIDVQWSNLYWDHMQIRFRAEANESYVVKVEQSEWPNPPPVSRESPGPVGELAGAAAAGALAGAAEATIVYSSPIWFPIAVGYLIFAPPPAGPPASEAMHLWIETKSGKVIAQCQREGPPTKPGR